MSYGGSADQGSSYANASNTEAGYSRGQEQHEMQNYSQLGQQQSTSDYPRDPFWDLRSSIGQQVEALDNDIRQIAQKQNQVLNSTNPAQDQQQLDDLVSRFRLSSSNILSQIHELKDLANSQDKVKQFNTLRTNFKHKVGGLNELEKGFRESSAMQFGRQYRIANPEASDAEVADALESGVNEGIFQQALRQDRTGQARSVLGNVQARHNEIKKIEQSMAELAAIFQDLDTMVVQQEAVIKEAEHQTEQTNINIGKGTEEVDKGIVHARRTRRNKWICFGIVVLIVVIAVAVGAGVGVTAGKNKP